MSGPLEHLRASALFLLATALVTASRPGLAEGTTAAPPEATFTFRARGARPVSWSPSYGRFGLGDTAVLGASAVAIVGATIAGPNPSGPMGGFWFDEEVQRALLLGTEADRTVAARVSDVLAGAQAGYALGVDPWLNAGWLRQSDEVARQVFLLNVEVLALSVALQQLTANAVGRERPYGERCGTAELDQGDSACAKDGRFQSFYSGHSSQSFALAAATCTHHTFLHLSGPTALWMCLATLASAGAAATLRVTADRHYASDVLVGSAVGALIGWGLPFLHYRGGLSLLSVRAGKVNMTFLPQPMGLTVVGQLP